VAWADAVGSGSRWLACAAGSPPTWPASWIFAWRHRLPAEQYDRLVGRYLFYRQNNLQGRVAGGGAGDDALLGEGWGAPAEREGADARPLLGPARVLAPLDVPEDIGIVVRAASDRATGVRVLVNGRETGAFTAAPGWTDHQVSAPAALWRRDLNDVVLAPDATGVWVDAVDFVRAGAPEGQERGFRAR
jgi:hypothetical protein